MNYNQYGGDKRQVRERNPVGEISEGQLIF